MNKIAKYCFILAILLPLLLSPIQPVNAEKGGNPDGGVVSGQVYPEISIQLPAAPTISDGGLIQPNATLLGGGSGTATAGLQWGSTWMKGIAKSTTVGTTATFQICAKVTGLLRNGVYKTNSEELCENATIWFQDSIQTTTTYLTTKVAGYTWTANTYHQFNLKDGSWFWRPTNSTFAKP